MAFEIAEELGIGRELSEVRELAKRDPWRATCRILAECLIAELVKKEGSPDDVDVLDVLMRHHPDPLEYASVMIAVLMAALEQALAKEKAIRLFAGVFGLEPVGAT